MRTLLLELRREKRSSSWAPSMVLEFDSPADIVIVLRVLAGLGLCISQIFSYTQ